MLENDNDLDMFARHANTVSDLHLAASRSNDPFWAKRLNKMADSLKEAIEQGEKLRCA